MHFGRVDPSTLLSLDLSLPPVASRTDAYLRLKHEGRGQIYCGAPIWACKDWRETVYPPRAKPSDYLRFYAQKFSMIELNSSFYQSPSPAQVRHWCEDTGPEFRFLPKVPKALSHELSRPNKALLSEFITALEAFDTRLGLPFMQLPEWFATDQFPLLEAFAAAWPKGMPLAIEFRHPSWFQGRALLDPVVNFLYRHQMATVITDTPGQRGVVHTSLSYPAVLLRFMGMYPSPTDQPRLKAWADRLEDWAHAGMDAIYVAIHQENNGSIPQTAEYLQRTLDEKRFEGVVRPSPKIGSGSLAPDEDWQEDLVLG